MPTSWTGQRSSAGVVSTLSREYVVAQLQSNLPEIVFTNQPVYLGLVPAGQPPQLFYFFPAEWVGYSGSRRRQCQILVGPDGGAATYQPGEHDLYARVEDTYETAVRRISGGVIFR